MAAVRTTAGESHNNTAELKFKVTDVPDKGKGWVATADIRSGELLLKEKHLFPSLPDMVKSPATNTDALSFLLGMLGTGRQSAAQPYTLCSSGVKDILDNKFAALPDQDKEAFMELYDPEPEGDGDTKVFRIMKNNEFADGLFLLCSRLNHSCRPNVQMSSDDEVETEVRALADIRAGEEVCVSYLRTSALRNRDQRQSHLLQGWQFRCCCPVCSLTGRDREENERAREAVRSGIKETGELLDSLVHAMIPRAACTSKLRLYFKHAEEHLLLLSTVLKGEAEPAVVEVLMNLASLAQLARSRLYRTSVPGLASSEHYMERARDKAGQLGAMFVTNTNTRDKELGRMAVAL